MANAQRSVSSSESAEDIPTVAAVAGSAIDMHRGLDKIIDDLNRRCIDHPDVRVLKRKRLLQRDLRVGIRKH